MIEATGVGWRYGANPVIDGVEVTAHPGRVLGLIGPNGSGKTTLLRLLYGALGSPTGQVTIDGDELSRLTPRESARRMAVVVQESGGETALTVAEMVLLGRGPHLSAFQRTGRADHEIAARCLARVGATHLGARAFAGLSGGERQRVLIARALAQQATHLLLDEPTNHLDIRYQHEILRLVRGLDTCSVVVLHDLNLAARYCDDLVLLGHGGVIAAGPAAEVLDPAVLEPVYGIGIRRLTLEGHLHLLFHPTDEGRRPAARPARRPRRRHRQRSGGPDPGPPGPPGHRQPAGTPPAAARPSSSATPCTPTSARAGHRRGELAAPAAAGRCGSRTARRTRRSSSPVTTTRRCGRRCRWPPPSRSTRPPRSSRRPACGRSRSLR
ncbi:MAG: ABC transporter ATP-binding protein [Actinoplanes sp.]